MNVTPVVEVVKAEGICRRRKQPKVEKPQQQQEVYEIIDLDTEDYDERKKKRLSGTNKFNPISVEQYIEDRDLHRANMASLTSNNPNFSTNKSNPISVEQYVEDRDLGLAIMTSLTPSHPNFGTNKSNPIFVGQYVEDRDLGLAIMTSLTSNNPNFIDLTSELLCFDKPTNTSFEAGQSSNSENDHHPPFVCEICFETKPSNDSFSIKGCSHAYCTDCVSKYVASRLQENVTAITCPVSGCGGSLEPEHCRSIIPPEVFDRWGFALCEALILRSQKFYCPYKDCSVMLIDDGEEAVRQSECPYCYRMFCAECKVPWHTAIECEEFRKLNNGEREKEDIMLMNLAKEKQWRRCPNCKFYVEKSVGCSFMRCRCGSAFCYSCGNIYGKSGVATHYCKNCRR